MKEGWKYKKLKEVGVTQTGTTPSKSVESYYGGEIPFIRPAELDVDGKGTIEYNSELKLTSEGASKSRAIKANSTLMCCIGSVGKTGYATKDITCNQQINTITPYVGYNGKFVYYALLTPSFQNEVIKIANSAKATLAIISKGKWEELSIPVPPLSEQQSIVDYLDSAFAKIDAMKANAEKALNEAKALFQASLKEMLEPKEGWEEKTLKGIGTTQTGTTPPKGDKDNYGDYMPFIRPSEIDYDGSGRIEYNSALKLSKKGVDNGRVFDAGSVYMVCIGATIGKVGYGERTISCNQQINIFTPNSSVNYKFAYYAMKSDVFQHKVIKEGTSSQATLPIINKGKWEKLTLSYPPLSEQQSIVATLDSLKSKVDRLQANYEKISKECDALKQALLKEVFEG